MSDLFLFSLFLIYFLGYAQGRRDEGKKQSFSAQPRRGITNSGRLHVP